MLAVCGHAVCEKYGGAGEEHVRKKYILFSGGGGGADRSPFVISPEGRIEHVFEKVKPEGHDQEVDGVLKSGAAKE